MCQASGSISLISMYSPFKMRCTSLGGSGGAPGKLEAQSQLQGVEVAGMGEQLQIGPEHLRVEELGQKQEMRTQA